MYDIGWSQKLFMKCTGSGLPTGEMGGCGGEFIPFSVLLQTNASQEAREISISSNSCIYSLPLPVILDAPLGQSSDVWVMVEPILAKTTRVSSLFS